uniref:Uncharacterized protein n=1 Tax=Rhizophora mucronata TaxID=61149 RepID=A0A2P2NYN3_RHIMU
MQMHYCSGKVNPCCSESPASLIGFMEIRKVDVLWNDRPRIPKPHNRPLLESIHVRS